jgi:endonuclease YncB( thermonuclease family)
VFGCVCLAWAALATAIATADTDPEAACRLPARETVRAQGAVDGRTIRLDDGREIRIAGIEVPSATEARAIGFGDGRALHDLVAGQDIVLRGPAETSDRYGRLIAWPSVGGEQALAILLLGQGQARFAAGPGTGPCLRAMLAAERSARAAKLGLWGDPRYESKRAENPVEVLAARGRFALVEGRVLSVRESGGTIYVNFGRRWNEDFTVTILKRNERMFVAAGLAPQSLQARRVRVRGVVEQRGGPWIEAVRPEQIEVVDGN